MFDEATRTYRRPDASDAIRRKAEEAGRVAGEVARIEDALRAKRVAGIDEHKRRVRAARVIQRWWRLRLYAPPDGTFYKRARERFSSSASRSHEPVHVVEESP